MDRDALYEGVPSFGRRFVMSDSVDVFPQTFSRLGLDDLFPMLPGLIIKIDIHRVLRYFATSIVLVRFTASTTCLAFS